MPLTPLVEDDKDKLDHLRMRSSWSTWDALKTLPDVQLARFRAIQVPGYTDRCWTRQHTTHMSKLSAPLRLEHL